MPKLKLIRTDKPKEQDDLQKYAEQVNEIIESLMLKLDNMTKAFYDKHECFPVIYLKEDTNEITFIFQKPTSEAPDTDQSQ